MLYAYDAARLLAPRDLLLVEAGPGRLRPLLGDGSFGSRGRVLAFGPLHLPFRGIFVGTWGRPWSDGARLTATLAALERLRGSVGMVRGIASLAFVLLFVAGPALTAVLGPDAAVVAVAALLYPTAVGAIVTLWWRRRDFGLTTGRTVRLSLELVVCPAFVPNLLRRITGEQRIEVDGAQLMLATATGEVREDFLAELRTRAEGMIDAAGSDPADRTSLRAYLGRLRGAP